MKSIDINITGDFDIVENCNKSFSLKLYNIKLYNEKLFILRKISDKYYTIDVDNDNIKIICDQQISSEIYIEYSNNLNMLEFCKPSEYIDLLYTTINAHINRFIDKYSFDVDFNVIIKIPSHKASKLICSVENSEYQSIINQTNKIFDNIADRLRNK
jgi:hypothetical protein